MLLNAAVIMRGLLAPAPECVWVIMHITVCTILRIFACAIIQLLFGFKIKTTDHRSESECGISGSFPSMRGDMIILVGFILLCGM